MTERQSYRQIYHGVAFYNFQPQGSALLPWLPVHRSPHLPVMMLHPRPQVPHSHFWPRRGRDRDERYDPLDCPVPRSQWRHHN